MKLEPIDQVSSGAGLPATQLSSSSSQGKDILTAAKGGGILFVGRLFEYTVRIVFSIVVARSLGAEQYGLYSLGYALVPILSMLALLGLQTGMVRYMPTAIRQRDDAGVWGIIQVGAGLPAALSLVLAAGLFLLADPLASQVFKEPRLAPVLRLMCLCIPLEALSFIAFTINQSFKRLEYNVLANNVVLPLTKLFLTMGVLATGLGTLGVVTAHVIASALGLALLVYFVNSLFSLKRPWRAAGHTAGTLLRYSLPTYPGWVINTVRGTFETLVLGILGLTTGVGIYTVTARFTLIGSMFMGSIAGISAPIMADLHSRREASQLKAFYKTTTRWLVMFNLPLFLTVVIFATPLLSIFGADFESGATALMILAVGTLVYTGTGVGATVLDMTDHPKVNSINSAFAVFIAIGLDLLLIPLWGVVGAATASALATVLINVVCLLEVFFLDHMLPYERNVLKPVVAGLVSAAVTCLINERLTLVPLLELMVGTAVLWSVYALTLIALGVSAEDLVVVNRVRSRLKFRTPAGGHMAR